MHSCNASTQVAAVKQQVVLRMRGEVLLRRDKVRTKDAPSWLAASKTAPDQCTWLSLS